MMETEIGVVHFDCGGRNHKPRNAGALLKLNAVSPGTSGRNAARLSLIFIPVRLVSDFFSQEI